MSILSLRSYPSVPRTDFGPAPPGYIPGVGRGAVGFTTRSDIGPAAGKDQEVPEVDGRARTVPSAHAKHAAVAVSNAALQAGAAAAEAQKKEEDLSDSRYDEFSGYSEQLFATGIYDAEDEEADLIYEAIDRRMDSRRKRQREEKVAAELEKLTKRRPRIDEQFADLKRGLGVLTEEQWDAIPEPLDFSRKNKLLNKLNPREKFTPVPDSIVAGAVAMNTSSNTMDMRTQLMNGLATPIGGTQTPATGTDQTAIGRARDKVLSLNLDRVADNVSGQTVVDPKGYLTDLNSVKVNSEAEVSDIKKARLLLKSVITTNPTHAPGWIAAARLEKETGKLVTARQTIAKGCEVCPTNEDVWLEAASMQTQRNAKAILAKAVTFIPTSIKIWMQACALEDDIEAKKAVLRRALELIPNSVKLWKAAVELEQPEDARIMLGRAVELVPQSVEMWLALAKLETYEKARIVLNRARKAIPTEPAIWITAAKLEEANGNVDNVQIIIDKAVTSLTKFQVTIDRDAWLQEAESADRSGSSLTCAAIVRATIGINVELEDRKNTWLADAEHYLSRQSMGVARAIYQHMLTIFPGKKSVWLKAASLERTHGTKETLDALLARAVEFCPQAEILWLMAAKEKWLSGDVNGARDILSKAFAANPDSEDIWLAAVKLESETAEYARARSILEKARDRAGTARVWMKSAKLERMLGDNTAQQSLLTRALDKFPNYYKLWIMQAQLYTQQRQIELARDTYKKGIKICPNAVDLWLCYAQFEITSNPQPEWGRARSILETARHKNPKEPRLWLQAIRIEQDANQLKVAQQLMAKALQECPSAGILWSHAIATDARPLRKARSYDALKRCNDDAHVFIAVAKLFWLDRKISKARNWFNRAVTVDPDLGDAWAWFYVFESEQENHNSAIKHESVKMETSSSTSSSAAATSSILNRIRIASPSHGELWTNISKQDQYQGKKADEILLLVIQQPVFKEIFPNPKTISE